MKTYYSFFIPVFAFSFFVFSCASFRRPDGNKGILQGMLYDYDNRPVCGYTISIDKKTKTFTDINGRFVFNDVPFGNHMITGEGNNHIPYQDSFDFNDKTQVLYIRVSSNDWLYSWIDSQIEKCAFSEVEKSLTLFSPDQKQTRKYFLYSAIYNFRTSKESESPDYLEKAEKLQKGY